MKRNKETYGIENCNDYVSVGEPLKPSVKRFPYNLLVAIILLGVSIINLIVCILNFCRVM